MVKAATVLAWYRKGGWVAQGSYPPRAPTDPYVRDYRIRLLRSWSRSDSDRRVYNSGRGKRVPLI